MKVIRIIPLIAIPAASFAATVAPTKEQTDFFETKVRPILKESCYKCHSQEAGKAKGGLTLDTREGWQKGGENGAAIAPGSPEKSMLIKAIGYLDPDLQMPPKGEKLAKDRIAVLTEWVKMGAPDPRDKPAGVGSGKLSGLTDTARQHWAYQPLAKPPIPINKGQSWCFTPVDAFILQKLEAKNMTPMTDLLGNDNDKSVLLRRATFDLTGLPPTLQEIDGFLRDKSPNAFEKVVDRLLASPQYGERWGRYWLDTARYSDTIGGERGNRVTEYRYPDAWTYRDYVIRSMNEDKPYNQFILEQLAADKLPDVKPDDARLAALGFITVGERFKNVNDIINDRIDVVSKGFLGLTVTCARCHDHMFDPIPTKDYYALHGIFASVSEPGGKPPIATKATAEQARDFQTKYNALLKGVQANYYDLLDFYLTDLRRAPAAYIKAAIDNGRGGKKPVKATEAQIHERDELIKANKLDEQFVQYLGRSMFLNPAVWRPLYEIQNTGHFTPSNTPPPGAEMMAKRMEEKMEQNLGGKAGKIAEKMRARMDTGTNRVVVEAFTKTPATTVDQAIEVYAKLFKNLADKGKAMIPAMKNANSSIVPGFEDEAMVEFLRGPFEIVAAPLMTADWIEEAQLAFPAKIAGRARLDFGSLNVLETSHPGAPAHAMVVTDKAKPVNSAVFIRGQAETKGPIVPRHFLEILSPGGKPQPFGDDESGRLGLAKAIASRDNPLTARVLINRVWMHHFGEGFVRTPDDLGVQSEAPTHRELLDYLAVWFMDNGWSFKKLHKVIMLSHVYMESSHTKAEYEQIDPENRLLWRANIRRLDFEAMRDSLLVFSGQLDRTLGGKPVNLTDEPYSYRRSVYGYIDRGNLPELMLNFDFSDPDMPNSRRTTTIVPQQALFLMNSPMTVDVARKIMVRPEVAGSNADYNRIASVYRIIFQRSPSPEETRIALQYLGTDVTAKGVVKAAPTEKDNGKNRYEAAMLKAKNSKFGAIQNEGTKVERKPLTAWETYAQALLFSNEAAYVN